MAEGRNAKTTIARESALTRGVTRPVIGPAEEQLAVIAIDTSLSMTGAKLDEANAATLALVSELADPKSKGAFHVALIAYAEKAAVQMQAQRANAVRPESLRATQGALGTNTNIASALALSESVLQDTRSEGSKWLKPVVVLLTDGVHTEPADPIAAAASLKAKADVIAVGFGTDPDMAMLERLANSPRHAVRCVNGSELRRFFATIGKTMSIAAVTGKSAAALLGGTGLIRGT